VIDSILQWAGRYRYVFKPKDVPVLTREVAMKIWSDVREGWSAITATLDMGLTTEVIKYVSNVSCVDIRGECIELSRLSELKENYVYAVLGGDLVPLACYDETLRKYYKLKPLAPDKAPTLEINGIHMHRCEGIDPWTDSILKLKQLGGLRRAIVLDTCTGLGYTASIAAGRGATLVVTSEVDPNVIKMSAFNPWSRGLASRNIVTIKADVGRAVQEAPDSIFTHILHDPPRFSVAGELYSREFYKELHRVLKAGGRLFHYTGMPYKHSNVSILKGIKRRLEEAGFYVVKWSSSAQGFIAVKPATNSHKFQHA